MIDIEKLFVFEHLPPHLKPVSEKFYLLAREIEMSTAPSAERTLALRALWESKNYAVWCAAQEPRE